ncbi:hypothetical protein TWF481_011288 [Arthrobotrys musiformis]|uniref:Nephrocystin 3-like N-terminal domain-containing protein n=1 Tax=Arthrobotrys musiformis TaxID=47236 RepID=A0AAV9VY44_9PEZI
MPKLKLKMNCPNQEASGSSTMAVRGFMQCSACERNSQPCPPTLALYSSVYLPPPRGTRQNTREFTFPDFGPGIRAGPANKLYWPHDALVPMFKTQPIRAATNACRKSLSTCLTIQRLKEGGWAENRLVDFDLWAAGAGVSAKGKLSLDQRLSPKPEIQNTIVNLLDLLKLFVENCKDLAKSKDLILPSPDESAKKEQDINSDQNNSASSGDGIDEPSLAELSSEEIEAQRDVEVTLDQIIRLTVAIRKAGSNSRLKRADRSFSLENPQVQELKGFLELIVHPRGLKEEGALTQIQSRLVEANLRRWHRFSYAKLHSKKLARADTVMKEALPEIPALPSEAEAQANIKPAVSFDIPEVEKAPQITIIAPQDEVPRAVSVIAPTATTAASAIEGNITVPDKSAMRNAATVISKISSRIAYPRPPNVPRYQSVFKCPCCLQSLPIAFTERSQWKKHLASDILPYTCVFEDCQQPLQLYLTRKDWEQHIKMEHGQLWACAACEQFGETTEFSNEDELVEHLETFHKDSVESDEIPMFVTASLSSKPVKVVDCPLCTGPDEDEDTLEHIAHCIHDFSLNSLPLPSESDAEDEYFDIDSRNSDSQNTPSSLSAEERDFEGLAELDDDNSSIDEDHRISESSLKTLAKDFSGPTGLSVLDWELDEAAEVPHDDPPVGPAGENTDEIIEDALEESEFYGPKQRSRYRVAWLCSSRMDAEVAEAMLDRVHLVPAASGGSASKFEYRLGRVGYQIVVVAWLSESYHYRSTQDCLAEEVMKLFRSLHIFLHVGTASGFAPEVYLADVVVCDRSKIFNYVFSTPNRTAYDNRQAPNFRLEQGLPEQTRNKSIWDYIERLDLSQARPRLDGLNEFIPAASLANKADHDPGNKYRYEHYSNLIDIHFGSDSPHEGYGSGISEENQTCEGCAGSSDTLKIRHRYGPPQSRIRHSGIASGWKAVEDLPSQGKLTKAGLDAGFTDLCCVVNEGLLGQHMKFESLVAIRGISSYTDKHKDARWKKVAAGAAASYAKEFIRNLRLEDFDFNETLTDASDSDSYSSFIGFSEVYDSAEPSVIGTTEAGNDGHITRHGTPPIKISSPGMTLGCIFVDLFCLYLADGFDDWTKHIKEHLVVPDRLSSESASRGWSHPQPLSWSCGFRGCEESQNLPNDTEVEAIVREPILGHAMTPLEKYRLQNTPEAESVLDSKLRHIYKHYTEDGWNLGEYEEGEDWVAYFQSVPVKPLGSQYDSSQTARKEGTIEAVEDAIKNTILPQSEALKASDQGGDTAAIDQAVSTPSDPEPTPEEPQNTEPLEQNADNTLKSVQGPGVLPLDGDFGSIHRKCRQDRDVGPYIPSWFTGLRQFKEWENTPGSALLFTGPPGAGKTNVMSWTYDSFREQYGGSADVVLIYLGENPPQGKDGRWTAHEVMHCIRNQHSSFKSNFKAVQENVLEKLSIASTLSTLDSLSSAHARKQFIFIDGLENLSPSERDTLGLSVWKSYGINLLCAAREGTARADDIDATHIINAQDTDFYFKRTIRQFLSDKFSKLPGILSRDPNVRDKYVDEIEAIALGLFEIASLFVELTTEVELETREDLERVKCIMFYGKFYDRVRSSIAEDAEKYAFKAITLVRLAEKPFSFSELQYALYAHMYPGLNADESELVSVEHLLFHCQGLLEYDESKDIVRLFHKTFHEYFSGRPFFWYPGGWPPFAERMVKYLSNAEFRAGPCQNKYLYDLRLAVFPYFRRAAMEWGRFIAEPSETMKIEGYTDEGVLSLLLDDNLVASINQVLKVEREHPPNYEVSTPIKGIHLAVYFGLNWLIESLVKSHGQNIEARDYNNHTPLAWAIDLAQVSTLETLVQLGASFYDIKHKGSTAMLEAVFLKNRGVDVIGTLFKLGHDLDFQGLPSGTHTRFAPFTLAILQRKMDIVDLFITKRASPFVTDGKMRSPLMCAVMIGDLDLVQKIIDRGKTLRREAKAPQLLILADNPLQIAESSEGLTPLAYAVSRNQQEIAKFLLSKESNLNATTIYGETVLDLAKKYGLDEIADLLIAAGAKEEESRAPKERIEIMHPRPLYHVSEDFPRNGLRRGSDFDPVENYNREIRPRSGARDPRQTNEVDDE